MLTMGKACLSAKRSKMILLLQCSTAILHKSSWQHRVHAKNHWPHMHLPTLFGQVNRSGSYAAQWPAYLTQHVSEAYTFLSRASMWLAKDEDK